jgi:hypothetical protein
MISKENPAVRTLSTFIEKEIKCEVGRDPLLGLGRYQDRMSSDL